MKAARWYGLKDVRIEDVAVPATPDNKIKVQVKKCGICGSDLHAYYHGLGVSLEPHPITGKSFPVTLGHEFGGEIVEIGSAVNTTLKVGDRITVEPNIYRLDDPMVAKGKYNLSRDAGFLGYQDDGGFAEYVLVDKHMVHKLPDGVSYEEAALVEPTAVAFQAVRNSTLKVGDQVAVFGVGPIGQLTVMCARMAGATTIVAVDVSAERLEMAKKCGATHVINGKDADVVAQIMAITGGVDVAYECAGVQATFDNALNSLVSGGELMIVAGYAEPVQFNTILALLTEKKISTSIGYRNVYPQVLAAIALKLIDPKKVVTKEIALKDLVKEGFEALHGQPKHSKILVKS